MFRVRRLIMETRGDAPRFAEQRLKTGGVRADDCSGKLRGREVPQDSLFHANSWHQEGAQMKPLRERSENDSSDADDFGAIAAEVKHVHALGNIEPQNSPQTLAEEAEIDGRDSSDARTRSDPGQCLGIPSRRDSDCAGEIRRSGPYTSEQGKHAVLYALEFVFAECAVDSQRFHQADAAQRQSENFLRRALAKQTDFKAAATKINNEPWNQFVAQCAENRGAHETRFLGRIDHLELYACRAANAANQVVAIARFTGGAGGHRAAMLHAITVQQLFEATKSMHRIVDGQAAEATFGECAMSQANRRALDIENLNFGGRFCFGNDKPNRVGTRIDGCDSDRGGQGYCQR